MAYKPKTTRIDRKRARLLNRAWKYFYQGRRLPPHDVGWLYWKIYKINKAWANMNNEGKSQ